MDWDNVLHRYVVWFLLPTKLFRVREIINSTRDILISCTGLIITRMRLIITRMRLIITRMRLIISLEGYTLIFQHVLSGPPYDCIAFKYF